MNDYHALIKRLNNMGILNRSGHWYRFFSMKNDEIPAYFDLSRHVLDGLEVKIPEAPVAKKSQFTGDPIPLSSFERKVLKAIVERPGETDVNLSKKLGITRSTVARIRTRLMSNCIMAIKSVDLEKIDFKIMTLVAPTLHYHSAGEKKNLLNAMQGIGPLVFSASGDFNFCMLYAFKQVKGIRAMIKKMLFGTRLKKGIHSELMLATFNLRNTNWIRDHEYQGLMEQVLERLPPTPKRRKRKLKKK
jgi:hypothetical protein